MTAPPSNVPNHPLKVPYDEDGDLLENGATYYLRNGVVDLTTVMTVDPESMLPGNFPAVRPRVMKETDNKCRWTVYFDEKDRTKIKLVNVANNQTLCVFVNQQAGTNWGAYLVTAANDAQRFNQPFGGNVCWYVYASQYNGWHWISSDQDLNCFADFWSDKNTGGDTLRANPAQDKERSRIEDPVAYWERNSSAQCWRFDPTYQTRQAKRKRREEEFQKSKQYGEGLQREQAGLKQEMDRLKAAASQHNAQDQSHGQQDQAMQQENARLKQELEQLRATSNKDSSQQTVTAMQQENDKLKTEIAELKSQPKGTDNASGDSGLRDENARLRAQIDRLQQQQPGSTKITVGGFNSSLASKYSLSNPPKMPERKVPRATANEYSIANPPKMPERKVPRATGDGVTWKAALAFNEKVLTSLPGPQTQTTSTPKQVEVAQAG